jgi:hypothetical protein
MIRAKWTVMSIGEQRAASWRTSLDMLIFFLWGFSVVHLLQGESIYAVGVVLWGAALYLCWKQARERWGI